MGEKRFGQAKLEWIKRLGLPITHTMDLNDSERINATQPLGAWFQVVEKRRCVSEQCPSPKPIKKTIAIPNIQAVSTEQFLTFMNDGYVKPSSCGFCAGDCSVNFRILQPLDVIVYTCDSIWREGEEGTRTYATKVHNKERDLPLLHTIQGITYEVAAYTMYTGNHYYAVICSGKDRFTYDGYDKPLKIHRRHQFIDYHGVSSVYLLKKNNLIVCKAIRRLIRFYTKTLQFYLN
ncbi:unnamed protein product [Allacma fusca]|uniref:Uncharacterized protein n=1 Tax=Allacma fusca TaxID=39272 RepID=A0A8J2KZP5_9HEXA|nr:unnamed protein product [Allacma fusca]